MSHPFGDLLSQHLHRKHGLSQSKLAAGILQAPTVITGMCKGRRLTGPQARERVLAIIDRLQRQMVLSTESEANALLSAAGMAPLQPNPPAEATLLRLLAKPVAYIDKDVTDHFSDFTATNHNGRTASSTSQSIKHNLLAQFTPFVGRTLELAELADLLTNPDVRLVTLVGSGGIGKTRLALATALQHVAYFSDGVYLISIGWS